MKARGYPVPGVDLMQVATLVQADLAQAGFEVRIAPQPPAAWGLPPGLVVEVRRPHGLLQRSTGHGAVLKVWLAPTAQGFGVRIGTDNAAGAAAGAVEWLLRAPALVTEGYAAFQQAQVDERILRVIDHFVANVSRVAIHRAPAPVPAVGPCAICKAPMPYGARFCPRCAHDTRAPAAPMAGCPGCRGPVALDAVFCPHCGRRVAAEAPPTRPCAGCALPLETTAVFCSGCGARQEPLETT